MLTIIHVCCPGDKQQAALIFTARAIGITWVNLDTHLPSTVPECLLFGKQGAIAGLILHLTIVP